MRSSGRILIPKSKISNGWRPDPPLPPTVRPLPIAVWPTSPPPPPFGSQVHQVLYLCTGEPWRTSATFPGQTWILYHIQVRTLHAEDIFQQKTIRGGLEGSGHMKDMYFTHAALQNKVDVQVVRKHWAPMSAHSHPSFSIRPCMCHRL